LLDSGYKTANRTIPSVCAKTVLQLLTHCYLLHLQHCSCFRDVVIDQIIGLHYIEVRSYDCCHQAKMR